MDTPSESASSGGHNADVLQMAYARIKSLQDENAALQANFEKLKELHEAAASTHGQLEVALRTAHESQNAAQAEYQKLRSSWREELESKQREVEELKKRLVRPRELEEVRLSVLQKLEEPHRQKCNALQKAAEQAQEKEAEARRETESIRRAMEKLTVSHSKEAARLKAEVEAVRAETEGEVRRLQGAAAGKEAALERATSLQKEVLSLQLEKRGLLQEVADVRQEKEAAVVEWHSLRLQRERETHGAQQQEVEMRRQVDSLARKCRFLETELERTMASAGAATQALASGQASWDSKEARLEHRVRELEQELRLAAGSLAAAEREWGDERAKLSAQLEESTRQKQDLVERQEAELGERAADGDAREAAAAARGRESVRLLEGEVADLRAALHALEDGGRDVEGRHEEALHEMQAVADAARREVTELEARRAAAEAELAGAQRRCGELQARLEGQRDELAAEVHDHHAARLRLKEAERDAGEMRETIASLEKRASQWERTATEATNENENAVKAAADRLEASMGAWAKEKADLVKQARTYHEALKLECRARLEEYKKRLKKVERRAAKYSGERLELNLSLSKAQAEVQALRHALQSANEVTWPIKSQASPSEPVNNRPDAWLSKEIASLQNRQMKFMKESHLLSNREDRHSAM